MMTVMILWLFLSSYHLVCPILWCPFSSFISSLLLFLLILFRLTSELLLLLLSSSFPPFVSFDIRFPSSLFSSPPCLASSSSSLLISLCAAASRKRLVNGNYWACPAPTQLGLSGPSTVVLERDSSRQSWPSSRRSPLTRPEAAGPPAFGPNMPVQSQRWCCWWRKCLCVWAA